MLEASMQGNRVGHQYALINTKNINKTWTSHKTNSSKDGQNSFLREIRSGNENNKELH